LGVSTSTEDAEGDIVSESDASGVSREDVLRVIPEFRGEILQTPPMVSAVHHGGKRLYELARKGIRVEREPRRVTIYALELLDFRAGERPEVELRVVCSSGTYIRTLCADMGRALGVGGHMSALARTRVGAFRIEDSASIEDVLSGRAQPISIDDALGGLAVVELDSRSARAVLHGNPVPAPHPAPMGLIKLRDPSGRLIALARLARKGGLELLQPDRVFWSPETSETARA